ncbi:MAG TPA: hypothetical protein VIY48_13175 [Candidatus Paceibacterota bacterium]
MSDAPIGDLPFRLGWIERKAERLEEKIVANTVRIETIEKDAAVDRQIQSEIRDDVLQLKRTLDRLVWAIVGLAFTIAGTAVGIAITAGVGG